MGTQHIDLEKRVAQYLALRAKIKKMDDEHKELMAPYREAQEKLNNVLLHHLNAINAKNARTTSGTVYITERRSASLADADAFMKYVIANNAWELIDRRANVTASFDHAQHEGGPPPGVNLMTRLEVGVRSK